MFSTEHTRNANQDYFQHFKFAYGLFSMSFVASLHFLAHGLTGGIYNAPKKYSLDNVTRFFSEQHGDLSHRKKS
mgnify:CR=1 FL=1